MEDKRHIEVIIKNTYEVIKQVYTKQQERNGNKHKENAGSRIIFPSYNYVLFLSSNLIYIAKRKDGTLSILLKLQQN